jgi:2,4-dienoyl-CoA reductase-like NADH-dependent reductase (Old Yellow Enzyme family)
VFPNNISIGRRNPNIDLPVAIGLSKKLLSDPQQPTATARCNQGEVKLCVGRGPIIADRVGVIGRLSQGVECRNNLGFPFQVASVSSKNWTGAYKSPLNNMMFIILCGSPRARDIQRTRQSIEDPMPSLFDPLTIGDLKLPNRVIMSPLTRLRAGESKVPNALMVDYYAQRASAGLVITECVPISQQAVAYHGGSAIWANDHVAGWKEVTGAVKAAGGRIFMQIWHAGRISDPVFHDGKLPVAPSAIAPKGNVSHLRPERAFVTPRALETHEVKEVVADFRRAAQFAEAAGFDGVELHGANGYLLDQFLQDGPNQRSDQYGGSIENRARLMLEALEAVIEVWGPSRVGMHLSTRGDVHSMGDSDRAATFGYVARELGRRRIAFLCVRERVAADSLGPELKKAFGGIYIANEGFTAATAQEALSAGWADAVAFGKAFIANPDLPERLRVGAPLNEPQPATFYGPGAQGYTDYPTLAQAAAVG